MYEQIISRMALKIEELERENRKLKGEQTKEDIEYEEMLQRTNRLIREMVSKAPATENSGH